MQTGISTGPGPPKIAFVPLFVKRQFPTRPSVLLPPVRPAAAIIPLDPVGLSFAHLQTQLANGVKITDARPVRNKPVRWARPLEQRWLRPLKLAWPRVWTRQDTSVYVHRALGIYSYSLPLVPLNFVDPFFPSNSLARSRARNTLLESARLASIS